MRQLGGTRAALAILLFMSFASLPARAEPSDARAERDPAAAQALFDQGRALLREHHYAEACAKLAESQRLDPGIGTQFHLADCYENWGKVASAWAAFLEVASLARASGQVSREALAQKRAGRLEARVPRLTISLSRGNAERAIEVTRDGVLVGAAQLDTALPIDPGNHEIRASAAGYRAFTSKLDIAEGVHATLEVPALEPELPPSSTSKSENEKPPLPALPPILPARASPRRPTSAPVPADVASETRVSGWVLGFGIAGVTALGAGATLGILAHNKYENSKDYCRATNANLCTSRGVELRNDAFAFGHAATAGFIAGGVALSVAAVIWFLNPPSKTARAHSIQELRIGFEPSAGRNSLLVRGRF